MNSKIELYNGVKDMKYLIETAKKAKHDKKKEINAMSEADPKSKISQIQVEKNVMNHPPSKQVPTIAVNQIHISKQPNNINIKKVVLNTQAQDKVNPKLNIKNGNPHQIKIGMIKMPDAVTN